ncbi:MAG: 4-hydroxy-3-methylbut-2-enyl diphosphate reductase [Candidatus Bipolaricaulia bacterium]
MKIETATVLGFCFGVRRAIDIVAQDAEKHGPLETFGTTVHNPYVINDLEKQGAKVVGSLDDVETGTVAITAHGVGEEIYQVIEEKGYRLVDTTCPIVSKAQREAHRLIDEGFQMILYGEADHKEVRGVLGWAQGKAIAIMDPKADVPIPRRKVALISQTTKGPESFIHFISEFLTHNMDRINEVRIVNTTCPETNERYAAAQELATRADLLIVIGGKHSANTRKLAETCRKTGVETYHIESADEIQPEWVVGKQHVGVTAGASTPDASIDAVVERLGGLSKALEEGR